MAKSKRQEPKDLKPAAALSAGGLFASAACTDAAKWPRYEDEVMTDIAIDFAKMDGLVPAIVQDAATGQVLMVGFRNEASYQKTLETGFVTFWSRTRQKLWMKGETSGNRLRIVEASTDCDQDTVL